MYRKLYDETSIRNGCNATLRSGLEHTRFREQQQQHRTKKRSESSSLNETRAPATITSRKPQLNKRFFFFFNLLNMKCHKYYGDLYTFFIRIYTNIGKWKILEGIDRVRSQQFEFTENVGPIFTFHHFSRIIRKPSRIFNEALFVCEHIFSSIYSRSFN